MIEAVADRLGGQALARQDGEPLLEPGLQCHDQRLGMRLPAGTPLIGGTAARAALDDIELGDAPQRLLRRRAEPRRSRSTNRRRRCDQQKAGVMRSA